MGSLTTFLGRASRGLVLAALAACGADATSADDAGANRSDAALAANDGTPSRENCTRALGSALGSGFGRLDGYLATVLAPGHQSCPSDADHVHLQIKASGGVYDIAITVVDTSATSVDYLAKAAPLPGEAWSEGWHKASLDYTALGLHAADFQPTPKATLAQTLDTELASANHISIFATAYPDHTGAHKVHRNGFGDDGALVINPTAPVSRLLLFHFATQSF